MGTPFETQELPIDEMVPNRWNPNEMDDEQFNLLAASVEEMGMVGSIQVIQLDEPENGAKYRIIGGEHRWKVARARGEETIRADVFPQDKFNEDMQKVMTVKLNIVQGKLNPVRFTELFDEMVGKGYEHEVLREMMGFADEEALNEVYRAVRNSLPSAELREALDEAREEIKTVDDLSLILNKIFTRHGSDLDMSFLVFDFGGEKHLMIQTKKDLKKELQGVVGLCRRYAVDINDVLLEALNMAGVRDRYAREGVEAAEAPEDKSFELDE